jgi:starvation-inducible DNA-binding protein
MNSPTIRELGLLVSDYQVLYQKLRNYHWNVKGPQFFELHALFMKLYEEAAGRVDEFAERILALGDRPPSTLKEQLGQARLAEDPETPAAQQMVRNVAADYAALTAALRKAAKVATDAKDETSFNLLTDAADAQEKTAWMLRSYLS